jgi:hypothetical protein
MQVPDAVIQKIRKAGKQEKKNSGLSCFPAFLMFSVFRFAAIR